MKKASHLSLAALFCGALFVNANRADAMVGNLGVSKPKPAKALLTSMAKKATGIVGKISGKVSKIAGKAGGIVGKITSKVGRIAGKSTIGKIGGQATTASRKGVSAAAKIAGFVGKVGKVVNKVGGSANRISKVAGIVGKAGKASSVSKKAVKAKAGSFSLRVRAKLNKWVDTKFGGDWDRAFRTIANRNNTDNTINREELLWALKQAGIGNWITRGAWADGIIKELEKDNSRSISEKEFNSVFRMDKSAGARF